MTTNPKKRKLNVRYTSNEELTKKWGINPRFPKKDGLFVRCNSKGFVNWEKAPVYRLKELLERGNVNIIID